MMVREVTLANLAARTPQKTCFSMLEQKVLIREMESLQYKKICLSLTLREVFQKKFYNAAFNESYTTILGWCLESPAG